MFFLVVRRRRATTRTTPQPCSGGNFALSFRTSVHQKTGWPASPTPTLAMLLQHLLSNTDCPRFPAATAGMSTRCEAYVYALFLDFSEAPPIYIADRATQPLYNSTKGTRHLVRRTQGTAISSRNVTPQRQRSTSDEHIHIYKRE